MPNPSAVLRQRLGSLATGFCALAVLLLVVVGAGRPAAAATPPTGTVTCDCTSREGALATARTASVAAAKAVGDQQRTEDTARSAATAAGRAHSEALKAFDTADAALATTRTERDTARNQVDAYRKLLADRSTVRDGLTRLNDKSYNPLNNPLRDPVFGQLLGRLLQKYGAGGYLTIVDRVDKGGRRAAKVALLAMQLSMEKTIASTTPKYQRALRALPAAERAYQQALQERTTAGDRVAAALTSKNNAEETLRQESVRLETVRTAQRTAQTAVSTAADELAACRKQCDEPAPDTAPCVFELAVIQTCTSTDGDVVVNFHNVANTTGCTYTFTMDWADGTQEQVGIRGGPPGPIRLGAHRYTRPGQYAIHAATRPGNTCGQLPGSYTFTLTA